MTEPWEVQWNERVGGFAEKVGKTTEEIEVALVPITGAKSEQALKVLADAEAAPVADIQAALKDLGIPSGVFKMNVAILRGPAEKLVEEERRDVTTSNLLPRVPDDVALLQDLQSGGINKVGETAVYSAVKVAIASRYANYFNLPELILKEIDYYAENEVKEPIIGSDAEDYIMLRKQISERTWGEVLKPHGFTGSWMTKSKMEDLIKRVNSIFMPGLYSFHQVLVAWYKLWESKTTGPRALDAVVNALGKGGRRAPRGSMQAPDTGPVRNAAKSFNNVINETFSGFRYIVAGAMAYESQRIKMALQNDRLPRLLGVVDRERMLKKLGIEVSFDAPRQEQAVAQYALAVLGIERVAIDLEIDYFEDLFDLGEMILWGDILINPPASGLETEGMPDMSRKGKPGGGPKF